MIERYEPFGTKLKLDYIRNFNPTKQTEKELIIFFKRCFNCILTRDDIEELTVLKRRISKQTAKYVQQFIDKDGLFKKLLPEIQALICRYLSGVEVLALQRVLHNVGNAVNSHCSRKYLLNQCFAQSVKAEEMRGLSLQWTKEKLDAAHILAMTRLQYLSVDLHDPTNVPGIIKKFDSFIALTHVRFCDKAHFPDWGQLFSKLSTSLISLKFHAVSAPPICTSLSNMPASICLKRLSLTLCNNLTAALLIRMLQNTPHLRKLTVKHCEIPADFLAADWSHLTALQHLNLSNNYLSRMPGESFSQISSLTRLKTLRLRRLKLDVNDIAIIRFLTNLTSLDLSQNHSICALGSLIAESPLTQLRRLHLSSTERCLLREIIPSINMRALTDLGVKDNSITNDELEIFKRASMSLRRLDLSRSFIDQKGIDVLGKATALHTLTQLDLSYITLSDVDLLALANLTNLTRLCHLNLSYNEIVKPHLLAGHSFRYLQFLSLEGNKITKANMEEYYKKVRFEFLVTLIKPTIT